MELIITTQTISKQTIKSIVNGMGFEKVTRFVQDGDCGKVTLQDFDGSRETFRVVTPEAAKLSSGYTL